MIIIWKQTVQPSGVPAVWRAPADPDLAKRIEELAFRAGKQEQVPPRIANYCLARLSVLPPTLYANTWCAADVCLSLASIAQPCMQQHLAPGLAPTLEAVMKEKHHADPRFNFLCHGPTAEGAQYLPVRVRLKIIGNL